MAWLYFRIGCEDGASRIYEIGVPGLEVRSISEPSPTVIHMLQWNAELNRIYAATEGSDKQSIRPGVSVYGVKSDGSLKKLADMFADLPDNEKIAGHHGTLN